MEENSADSRRFMPDYWATPLPSDGSFRSGSRQNPPKECGRGLGNSIRLALARAGDVEHVDILRDEPASDELRKDRMIQVDQKERLALPSGVIAGQRGTPLEDTPVDDERSVGIGDIASRPDLVPGGVRFAQRVPAGDWAFFGLPSRGAPPPVRESQFDGNVQCGPVDTGLSAGDHLQVSAWRFIHGAGSSNRFTCFREMRTRGRVARNKAAAETGVSTAT